MRFPLQIGTRRQAMELSFRTFLRNSAAPIQRLYALAITTVMGEWCAANGRAPGLQPRRDCNRAARMEARHRCNCVAAYNQ